MNNNFDVERELDELYQEVTEQEVTEQEVTEIDTISASDVAAIEKQVKKSEELDKTIDKEIEEVKKGKNHKKLVASLLISASVLLAGYEILKFALNKQSKQIKSDLKKSEIDEIISEIKEAKKSIRKYANRDRINHYELISLIEANNTLYNKRLKLDKLRGSSRQAKHWNTSDDQYSQIKNDALRKYLGKGNYKEIKF